MLAEQASVCACISKFIYLDRVKIRGKSHTLRDILQILISQSTLTLNTKVEVHLSDSSYNVVVLFENLIFFP